MKKIKLGGIIEHRDLHFISLENLPDRPGVAGLIFQALGHRGINVQFIIQGLNRHRESQVILAVAESEGRETLAVMEELRPRIGHPDLTLQSDRAIISIFGPHFRERPGIAGTFFQALGSRGINILAVSTSISTCSCVIEAADLAEAVKAVGEAFELPGSGD
jgi:aspartate kinase